MALTDNLVGVWCEAAAPETDESVNGETLTNNSVGTTTGKVGTAGTFTNPQYLFHADDANLSTGDIDFTIAAWVWLTSKPAYSSIAGKVASDGSTIEYALIYRSSADQFEFDFNASNQKSATFGSTATGTWYWVCGWHDATANTVNITVNNGAVDSSADSGGVDRPSGFAVGRLGDYSGDPNAQWDGQLNQVAMWKRVLTSGERISLYNSGLGLAFASWGGGAAARLPLMVNINQAVMAAVY